MPLLNPWWHGGSGGLGEMGEKVLKARGIEIWSLGNGLEEGYGVTAQELIPRRSLLPGRTSLRVCNRRPEDCRPSIRLVRGPRNPHRHLRSAPQASERRCSIAE